MPDPIPPAGRPAPSRAGDSGLTPDPKFWGEDRPRRRLPPRPRMGSGLERLTDRIEEWRSDARLGVVALVIVAVIAGVVWYRVGVSGGSEAPGAHGAAASTRSRSAPPSGATATTAGARGKLVVHVAGAVTHPGVVELPSGARVIDAIEAAGGGLANADLDRLNLAAKLADGQRVLVQRVGDPPAANAGTGTGAPAAGDAPGAGSPINLNTATAAQLDQLPGIGPSLAAAIIAERDRRGGFRSVNELRDVRGIGEKRFADLRDRVTV